MPGKTYMDAVHIIGDDPRQWWYICDTCLKKDGREYIRRLFYELKRGIEIIKRVLKSFNRDTKN